MASDPIEEGREYAAEPCSRHAEGSDGCRECGILDSLQCTIEALDAATTERDRLSDRLDDAYRFILQHADKMTVTDHACAQCVPRGEIVVPGFVCVRHLAEARAREVSRG